MGFSHPWSYRLAFITIYCLVFNQVSAFNVEYCSTDNTATTGKNSSIFQSNGLCYNFCLQDYAFAIVQGSGCWCSDYAPGFTTTGCTEQCPGYPDDLCGGDGVYGYIALSKAPSGTDGGSGAAASTSVAQIQTVTATPEATTVFVTPPSSSPSSSFSSTSDTTTATTPLPAALTSITHSSSSSSSSTWTPTPVISLETVTGQIRTVTVTPTVPPNSQSLTGVSRKNGGGLSTGSAVGLTIGLVALVAIVCGIIYFCIRKRRQDRAENYSNPSRRGSTTGLGGPVPSRTMSENSRYFLGTDGRQVVETWEPDTRDAPGSRKSRLMPVDPRLDPFAPLYQRGENKSRESVNTLRDDHDYSRRVHQQAPILRATNPDNDE